LSNLRPQRRADTVVPFDVAFPRWPIENRLDSRLLGNDERDMEFLRTLLATLKLALFVRPHGPARRIGPGQFWSALALVTAARLVESWLEVDSPRRFDPDALGGIAFYALLALLTAYAAARVLQRPAIFWPLVVLLFLLENALAWAARAVFALLPDPPALPISGAYVIWCAWLLLAVRRTLDWLEPHRGWPVRSIAALAIAFACVLPPWFVHRGDPFYTAYDEALPGFDPDPEPPAFEPEVVMADQYAV
jgi:hypothetical protein